MKQLYLGGLIALLVSCKEQDLLLETEKEVLPMRVEASIAQDAKSARTAMSGENAISFSENDCIGLFVPWENTARKWTYSGTAWNSLQSVYWKDKETNYKFYAYYPGGEEMAVSVNSVSMPDLSSQEGTIAGLAKYDFLVASTIAKYSTTNNGTLSFTGNNAFQHVLSRITFSFDKSSMDDAVQLQSIRLESNALSANNTCNLTTKEISSITNSQHEILSNIVEEKSEMLVHPISNATVTLSVVYQINSANVTVSKEISNFSLQMGSRHTMSVKIEQGTLTISEATIAPWGEGSTLNDVTL